jgi:hypothetical protein
VIGGGGGGGLVRPRKEREEWRGVALGGREGKRTGEAMECDQGIESEFEKDFGRRIYTPPQNSLFSLSFCFLPMLFLVRLFSAASEPDAKVRA